MPMKPLALQPPLALKKVDLPLLTTGSPSPPPPRAQWFGLRLWCISAFGLTFWPTKWTAKINNPPPNSTYLPQNTGQFAFWHSCFPSLTLIPPPDRSGRGRLLVRGQPDVPALGRGPWPGVPSGRGSGRLLGDGAKATAGKSVAHRELFTLPCFRLLPSDFLCWKVPPAGPCRKFCSQPWKIWLTCHQAYSEL